MDHLPCGQILRVYSEPESLHGSKGTPRQILLITHYTVETCIHVIYLTKLTHSQTYKNEVNTMGKIMVLGKAKSTIFLVRCSF